MFDYVKLGKFTYTLIRDEHKIKPFLLQWVGKEWEVDHREFPDQLWTLEWLEGIRRMSFQLEMVDIDEIKPRTDLMSYEKDGYSFATELKERADEREESMMRGITIEPLIINKKGFELMDGYTRYTVLKRHGEKQAYAYVGVD